MHRPIPRPEVLMHLFYSTQIKKDRILLDAEESRHLAKVLRMNAGDEADAIDGMGNRYHCMVDLVHPKKSVLQIVNSYPPEEKFGIHLAVAPTKNLNRWEWFLEKATEIGIDRITPLLCAHSERKVLKMESQKRILIAAMKQSLKATMPQLDEMQSLSEFLKNTTAEEKLIAHCDDQEDKMSLKSIHKKNKSVCLLIGPEGDFSPAEIDLAKEQSFIPVGLGKSRLRTETAAIVALHSIHLLNE